MIAAGVIGCGTTEDGNSVRTAKDCLLRAQDMEQQARLCPTPGHAAELISMASVWRQLAQQALWQDAVAIPGDPEPKPAEDTALKAS